MTAHKYTVGKPYNPHIKHWPVECAHYTLRRGHHELLMFLARPTDREVESVRQGPAEFALYVEPPVLMLVYRFEPGLPWSDAPCSIHLVPPDERELPAAIETEETRALLRVLLIDAGTGILLAIRAVSLSPTFTSALHAAIRAQAVAEWDHLAYDAKLAAIRCRAEPAELARVAAVRCRGGE